MANEYNPYTESEYKLVNSFNTYPSTLAPFQLFSHLGTAGRRNG